MRHALLIVGAVACVALGAAAACSSDTEDTEVVTDGGSGDVITAIPNVDSSSTSGPEAPAGTGGNTGLPCDVQAVLENRCIACHDGKTAVPMLTYSDVAKKSSVDPTKTIAELALIRMQSKTSPMPPPPAEGPDAEEIAIFDAWAKAGFPKEAKACTDPPPDGGLADAGPKLDGAVPPDAGDAGAYCTSGVLWTQGNDGNPLMNPGMACNACHQVMGGPNLRLAGTVYTALNEKDLCYGHPQLTVRVTGADGKIFDMPVNNAGNFYFRGGAPKAPFKAMVIDGQKTRAMVGTVTSGDCNSCHTQTGKNNAPGRIIAP